MRRAALLTALLLLGLGASGCADPADEGAPAETPLESSASSSDRTTSYAQYLDELAGWAGFTEVPEVETTRVLQDGVEHTRLVGECLAEAGFVRDPEDGRIAHTEEQFATFQLAMYTCHAQYRLDDRLYEPFTDSQIRFVREFWIESTIPCLRSQGYEIADPPSAETVVGTWGSVDAYHPEQSLDVLNLPLPEHERLIVECPMLPPATEIWEH